ncbi:Fc.00g025820.m01.CDS01 [Cosmosporella sp. VM-42]
MASSESAPLLSDGASRTPHPGGLVREISHDVEGGSNQEQVSLKGSVSKSPGVARMNAISSQLTAMERVSLFLGIFIVGYAYGLESQVRSAYQPYATSSFSLHSYSSTINVLRSVIAVASQPTAAKIADVFGRLEVVAISTILYTVGIAIEASAGSIEAYCLGGIIYQVGYTCIVLLMEVLIADFSSMRARVFFSYVPALPFLINTWISGSITAAVLRVTTWRWGVGMWCIIYPVASIPLFVTLYTIDRRARKSVPTYHHRSSAEMRKLGSQLYYQLDLIGLVILIAVFSLILAPLTLAGGAVSQWRNPSIMSLLVLGFLGIPTFVYWEKCVAKFPLVPFHLLTDRGVWAALAVRTLLNFAWSVQGNYLYTVLIVAFDFPIETATRILSLFSFFGVLSGVAVGLVIYKIRKLKYIIVAGTCFFMIAFGLLIKSPGGPSEEPRSGLIGGQILLGLAGGLFAYPTQASIQAAVSRDYVAVLTSLYLSFYNVGSAFGTCLSGLIWTQVLYPTLKENLAFQPNATLAKAIYDSPFSVISHYPVGTEIRSAIVESYQHVQRLLCIAGICLCVPMIAFALALRNPRLSEQQVQPEADDRIHR